jgi:hypothetical protein
LDKIINLEPLTLKDRKILSDFISVFIKRVPDGLARAYEWYDEVSDEVFDYLKAEIEMLIEVHPDKRALLESRIEELEEHRDDGDITPKQIWEKILPPDVSPVISIVLRMMHWQFFVHDHKPAFLTSDNPVFFFKDMGVGKTRSELTFPISQYVTLWASWRQADIEYIPVDDEVVKEINRRTVDEATRYVFFSKEADWIINLVNKDKLALHFID